MENNANALNWFEIPATDLPRAKKFYETIFSCKMIDSPEMMGMKMAMFPADSMNGKVGGGVCQSEFHKPSQDGSLVYLNTNPNIQTVIDRVEAAGGKVIMPKTQISPEIGFMAFIIDTEGNRIGLHGQN